MSKEDKKLIELIFLEDIPAISGVDGKSYGPFNIGENGKIPLGNAEFLLKKEMVIKPDRLVEIRNSIKDDEFYFISDLFRILSDFWVYCSNRVDKITGIIEILGENKYHHTLSKWICEYLKEFGRIDFDGSTGFFTLQRPTENFLNHLKIKQKIHVIDRNSQTETLNEVLSEISDLEPLDQENILQEMKKKTGKSINILRKQLEYLKENEDYYFEEVEEETFSEDIENKAMEFLQDSNILSVVNGILEHEMTGDEHNRLFYFIIGEARKYKTQLIRAQGQTTAGKNWEIKWIDKVFPNTHEFASSTASHFIRKVKDDKIDTKNATIIHSEDRKGSGNFNFNIDQLYGKEKIKVGLSVKEGGDWKSVDIEIEGPLVFYTTSTEKGDEHRRARGWVTNPDESLEQNERISRWKKWKKSLSGEEIEEHKRDMEIIKCFLSKLKKYDRIIIPYWDFVFFQHRQTDDRRKEDNFETMLKMVTHIHQYQRPRDENLGILVSLPQDLYMAWKISEKIMKLGREGLTERQKKMIKVLRDNEIGERDEEGRKLRYLADEKTIGGGTYFTINDCLKHDKWVWEYQVSYNNLMEMLSKGVLVGNKRGRQWLFSLKEQFRSEIDFNSLSHFIKVSSSIFDKNKVEEGLKRIFSKKSDIYSHILEQFNEIFEKECFDPFDEKIGYEYDKSFIKRETKEGNGSINLKKELEVLLKDDKELKNIPRDFEKELNELLKYMGEKIHKDEFRKKFPSEVIKKWLSDGRILDNGEYFTITEVVV